MNKPETYFVIDEHGNYDDLPDIPDETLRRLRFSIFTLDPEESAKLSAEIQKIMDAHDPTDEVPRG